MKTLLGLSLFTLVSCATSSMDYSPPNKTNDLKGKVTVDKNFKEVWTGLIDGLSSGSFKLVHVEKDSGLITLTKNISDPVRVADCGNWDVKFKNLRGDHQYLYNGVQSTQFSWLNNGVLINTTRTSTLDSSGSVFVKKISEYKTMVRVSLNYDLKIKDQNNYYLYPQGNQVSFSQAGVKFSTTEPGRNPAGKTECVSRGILEGEILELVQ